MPTMMHVSGRAHPRSRGENPVCAVIRISCRGSSPLTRGKPSTWRSASRARRLIPAHAGKTRGCSQRSPYGPAHPRSRGENAVNTKAVNGQTGSSPLTRGKPWCAAAGLPGHGLIPAHAGKTAPRRSDRKRRRAHPRSRGENITPRPRVVRVKGSSPLTRGKRVVISCQ